MPIFGVTAGREISRRMVSERASRRAFFGVSALLFAASAAVTIVLCASMSAMGEMPMPGGWTMAMAWHVPPPPANQIVYVKSAQGFEIGGTFEPVTVTGTIKTTVAFTGLADAGYTLEADAVQPRKERHE